MSRWTRPLDGLHPDPLPLVSIVIAHFEQPTQLRRTLLAIERQRYPRRLLDVIVVDDGSAVAPVVPADVRLLSQEDRGFRLSAARNLGAAAARGSVLCFLDADTVPEPDYVRELTRLPALVPDAVTVGVRKHADLAAAGAEDPVETAGPVHESPAPEWLAAAYERSRDLGDADHRSYRFLIGAVLACGTDFFEEVGGFDESFTSYGGEDWEWGYRAWLAGATLAHVPTAVAWHDGPDWAGRSGSESARTAKNREAMTLASAIPTVGSRGRGVRGGATDVVVEIAASSSVAALFVCVDSVLEGMPHALVVAGQGAQHFAADPRVVTSMDPAVHPLVRVLVSIDEPVRVDPREFGAAVEAVGSGRGDGADLVAHDRSGAVSVLIRSTRTARRRARAQLAGDAHDVPAPVDVTVDWITQLRSEPDLEAYLGGWG